MRTTPFCKDEAEYVARPRVMALLAEAAQQPLTIVCAGAGCGKTRAVYEFTRSATLPTMWMHLSESDNAGSRFWAKYVQLAAGWDITFAKHCKALGFPDTEDKINQYLALRRQYAPRRPHLFVLDDAHLIHHLDILRFIERRLRETVKNSSVILVCREQPALNLTGLQVRGLIPSINEGDLAFTENELAQYLSEQNLSVSRQILHDILCDTDGWAFSVNLTLRLLKRSPGYAGYARVAMKQSIFKLMETEVFNAVSPRLQRFLVQLSLIDHLSIDLVTTLAKGNRELLAELAEHNAYIRLDSSINAYLIHHLFLDFLRSRHSTLSSEELQETYRAASTWCCENGFEIDALTYLEKLGDYEAIVALLAALPVQMPLDIARLAAEILERAPSECSNIIFFFAVMRVRLIMRLGHLQEALTLIEHYEQEFMRMPADDALRNKTLGALYYSWGNIRALLGTTDDRYDFDQYYARMDECLTQAPLQPGQYADMPLGFWASLVGSAREGALQEYVDAASRAADHLCHCWGGSSVGIDVLCLGELRYYQGDMQQAEILFTRVLAQAAECQQFEIEYKALFYLLRIALWRGNREKAEQALSIMETRLERESYAHRFYNFDAATGWYYCALRQVEMVPAWLREQFAPYAHAYFLENLGNQIKARAHYLMRNYAPLLAYIEGMMQRESILYGRVEMLVLQACMRYQMKERPAAFDALRQAYEEARREDILMPFIELGRDMRTLVSAYLREDNCDIPHEWLENVQRKSATFAKHQSLMISSYQRATGSSQSRRLSVRELDILADLYHGLSRSEIAARQALSINTINSGITSIFNKLGARSIADVVRIAAEEKLV